MAFYMSMVHQWYKIKKEVVVLEHCLLRLCIVQEKKINKIYRSNWDLPLQQQVAVDLVMLQQLVVVVVVDLLVMLLVGLEHLVVKEEVASPDLVVLEERQDLHQSSLHR